MVFGAALTEQEAEIDVLLNKIADDHPDDVNKDHTCCKRRRYQTYHYHSTHHFHVTNAEYFFLVGFCLGQLEEIELENVSTANALQLKAGRRRAIPIRFRPNFVARAKFEVAQPICCRLRAFLLLIRYVTL